MPIKILALIRNAFQCDHCWSELRLIDQHWFAMIGIDIYVIFTISRNIWDQCCNFDRNWSALGNDPGSPDKNQVIIKCTFFIHWINLIKRSRRVVPQKITFRGVQTDWLVQYKDAPIPHLEMCTLTDLLEKCTLTDLLDKCTLTDLLDKCVHWLTY